MRAALCENVDPLTLLAGGGGWLEWCGGEWGATSHHHYPREGGKGGAEGLGVAVNGAAIGGSQMHVDKFCRSCAAEGCQIRPPCVSMTTCMHEAT